MRHCVTVLFFSFQESKLLRSFLLVSILVEPVLGVLLDEGHTGVLRRQASIGNFRREKKEDRDPSCVVSVKVVLVLPIESAFMEWMLLIREVSLQGGGGTSTCANICSSVGSLKAPRQNGEVGGRGREE